MFYPLFKTVEGKTIKKSMHKSQLKLTFTAPELLKCWLIPLLVPKRLLAYLINFAKRVNQRQKKIIVENEENYLKGSIIYVIFLHHA